MTKMTLMIQLFYLDPTSPPSSSCLLLLLLLLLLYIRDVVILVVSTLRLSTHTWYRNNYIRWNYQLGQQWAVPVGDQYSVHFIRSRKTCEKQFQCCRSSKSHHERKKDFQLQKRHRSPHRFNLGQ